MKGNKLEMIYLMNVALYLPTLHDIKTFEQINRKSTVAVHSLKVNPWMKTIEDILRFTLIFKQETINFKRIDDERQKRDEEVTSYSNLIEKIPEILKNVKQVRNLPISMMNGLYMIYGNVIPPTLMENVMKKCSSMTIVDFVFRKPGERPLGYNLFFPFYGNGYGNEYGNNNGNNNEISSGNHSNGNEGQFLEFFNNIHKKLKITCSSISIFKIIETTVNQMKEYMRFYPQQVIVMFNREGAIEDFPVSIDQLKSKNITFVSNSTFDWLTNEQLKRIKDNEYSVYMKRFDASYKNYPSIKYLLSTPVYKRQYEEDIPFGQCLFVSVRTLCQSSNFLELDRALSRLQCGIELIDNEYSVNSTIEFDSSTGRLNFDKAAKTLIYPSLLRIYKNIDVIPFHFDEFEEIWIKEHFNPEDKRMIWFELDEDNILKKAVLEDVGIRRPYYPMTFTGNNHLFSTEKYSKMFGKVKHLVMNNVKCPNVLLESVEIVDIQCKLPDKKHRENIPIVVKIHSPFLKKCSIRKCQNSSISVTMTKGVNYLFGELKYCELELNCFEEVDQSFTLYDLQHLRITSDPQCLSFIENIRELSIENCENIRFTNEFKSLIKLTLVSVKNSQFAISSTAMERCVINSSSNISFINTTSTSFKDSLKQLFISDSDNISMGKELSVLEFLELTKVKSSEITVSSREVVKCNAYQCFDCTLRFNMIPILFHFVDCSHSSIEWNCENEQLEKGYILCEKCHHVDLSINCDGGIVELVKSENIKLNPSVLFEYIGIVESFIVGNEVKTKRIKLDSIKMSSSIDYKTIKCMEINNVEGFNCAGMFPNCEELKVSNCFNSKFFWNDDEAKHVKRLECIDNEHCNLGGHSKNEKLSNDVMETTEESTEEIVDLSTIERDNKPIIIRSQKDHIILRNGKYHRVLFATLKHSAITLENCLDIKLDFFDLQLKQLSFINCKWERMHHFCDVHSNVFIEHLTFKDCPLYDLRRGKYFLNPTKSLTLDNVDVMFNVFLKEFRNKMTRVTFRNMNYCRKYTSIRTQELVIDNCHFVELKDKFESRRYQFDQTNLLVMKNITDPIIIEIHTEKCTKAEFDNCHHLNIENHLQNNDIRLKDCSELTLKGLNRTFKMNNCQNINLNNKFFKTVDNDQDKTSSFKEFITENQAEIHLIEEWSNTTFKHVLFDSKTMNISKNSDEFANALIGKEKVAFIIEDEDNNQFGCFISATIPKKDKRVRDQNVFTFSLKSTNPQRRPMKYPLLPTYTMFDFLPEDQSCLFSIGGNMSNGCELYVAPQENSLSYSYCSQYSFDYHGIENALCGKQIFMTQRIVVLQMHETEEQQAKRMQMENEKKENHEKRVALEKQILRDERENIRMDYQRHISQIEEWTKTQMKEIVFDSKHCLWGLGNTTFYDHMKTCEQYAIIIRDTNENVFGFYHLNDMFGCSSEDTFVFSLRSNNRFHQPTRFELLEDDYVWVKTRMDMADELFSIGVEGFFGDPNDIVVFQKHPTKQKKHICEQKMFDYQDQLNALCGNSTFEIDRFIVVQFTDKNMKMKGQ